MSDDTELLRRYSENRSEEAFAEFVRRHINLVYAAALRRTGGAAHHASEITQQVFSLAARHAPSLARHACVSGWLYRVTRNAAVNLMRDEQRRLHREQAASAMIELLNEGNEPKPDWHALRPFLDAAMDDLSSSDRDVVLLRFFEGRAMAEIGLRYRLTENAARMRVERAVERLGIALRRRGVASTSAAVALVLSHEAGMAAPAGMAATVASGAVAASTGGAAAGGLLALFGFGKMAAAAAVALTVAAIGFSMAKPSASRRTNASAQHVSIHVASTTPAQPAANPLRPTPHASAQDLPEQFTSPGLLARGNEFLEARPDVREMFVDYTRLRTLYEFAPILEPLGLTSAQIEALVQAKEAGAGLYFGMRDNHIAITLSLTGKLPNEQRERVENDVRAILGDAGYRQYQQALRVRPAEAVVADLAGGLFWSRTPLTAGQARALTATLLDTSPDYQRGQPFKADWDTLLPKAATILAEPQLAELIGIRARYRYGGAYNQAQAAYRKARATNHALSWKEVQAKDPALEALWVESDRAGLQRRYGALFRGDGPTGDRQRAFADAVVRHDAALLDLEATGVTQGLSADDAAIAALRRKADAELRAALVPLLGEAGFAQFEEYERSWFVPAAIAGLGGALTATNTPLTPEQADQLTQIILRASPRYQRGDRVDSNSDFQDETVNHSWRGPVSAPYEPSAVFAPARAVLSDRQFAYFGATWAQVYVPKIMNAVREYTLQKTAEADEARDN